MIKEFCNWTSHSKLLIKITKKACNNIRKVKRILVKTNHKIELCNWTLLETESTIRIRASMRTQTLKAD